MGWQPQMEEGEERQKRNEQSASSIRNENKQIMNSQRGGGQIRKRKKDLLMTVTLAANTDLSQGGLWVM